MFINKILRNTIRNKDLGQLFGRVFWIFCCCNLILYSISNFFNLHSFILPYLFPTQNTSSEVVIVDIDEDSIQHYGKWPWSRETQNKVLNKVLENNPKRLGIDILYANLDDKNSEDLALIETLNNPKIVSAIQLNTIKNTAEDQNKDKKVGFIEFGLDSSGNIRKALTKQENNLSLANQMTLSKNVPDSFLINPKTNQAPTISVKSLMENESLGKILEDKYVLIGTSALSLNDFHNLSGTGNVTGASIHARIIQQILGRHFWEESNMSILEFLGFVLLIGLILQFISNWCSAKSFQKVLILFNISILIIFLGNLWQEKFLDLNATIPLLITNLILPVFLWIADIKKEKEDIKNALSMYISPKIMQKVMQDPSKVSLGGKKYQSSIMFTDIRGFTTLSESVENVSEIAGILNQILGLQTEVVLENDGVVDKYIGDAVMAFWGAPIEDENYAYHSILSACQIQERLKEFNQKFNQEMLVGVGINTGISLIGNFGSHKRLDFTAIGDTVNTAARIEGVTKYFDAKIVISESTVNALNQSQRTEFWIEELDNIKLKGKQNPIRLFEVLGQINNIPKKTIDQKAEYQNYQSALQHYYSGNFKKAIDLASKISLKRGKLIKTRSEELLASDIKDWNGVWTLDHK